MYSLSVNGFEQWREVARALINANIAPPDVSWQAPEQQSLFSSNSLEEVLAHADSSSTSTALKVPPDFLAKARQASCYLDMQYPTRKWSILYSLLWRLKKDDRETLQLTSDVEVRILEGMCKAVSRDRHKMKAFVRFQKVANDSAELSGQISSINAEEYYVAWFEPSHAIVESVAPFFAKRFTGMSWSILTPQGCAHWDMDRLKISEGVRKPDISADVFDLFWRTYYRNIFNPARLKERAMRSEMPKKYWKYLPEASCIQDLVRGAAASTAQMINAPATSSSRAREKSKMVTHFQDNLRAKSRDYKCS